MLEKKLREIRVDKIIENIMEFAPEQIMLIKATVYDAFMKNYKKEYYLLSTGIAGNCPFLQAHGSANFIKNFVS